MVSQEFNEGEITVSVNGAETMGYSDANNEFQPYPHIIHWK